MGLDSFAHVVVSTQVLDGGDFYMPDYWQDEDRALHYWRKHQALHNWASEVFVRKGGGDPDCNLLSVRLDEADLDSLEAAIEAGDLLEYDDDESEAEAAFRKPDDREFLAKAREALVGGFWVYYVGWW